MVAIRNLPLLSFCIAMIALGGARMTGGMLLMSTPDARLALSRGEETPASMSSAAKRLALSTAIWPYDARALDALGAVSLKRGPSSGGERDACSRYATNAFTRAIELAPGQPLFWMRRAAAKYDAGHENDAARDLEQSIAAGPFHPQAVQFRFQLGLALWARLPGGMRRATILQGVSALRQGKEGLHFVARQARRAPADFRNELFMALTLEERSALVGAMRRW